ncbi:hypothetical protein [Vibrio cholerae]|uniref:hypothetical protein n=1 Tax=Vibrio cholerae TaxID=666 RepID=UPI000AE96633|nr:hypothetical protein [Vibrio cholerae]
MQEQEKQTPPKTKPLLFYVNLIKLLLTTTIFTMVSIDRGYYTVATVLCFVSLVLVVYLDEHYYTIKYHYTKVVGMKERIMKCLKRRN